MWFLCIDIRNIRLIECQSRYVLTGSDMATDKQKQIQKELAESLESELFSRHGPMISGDELRKALGYVSKEAFRQSLVRKTVPVPVFEIDNRRGKFALVKDVANWLAKQRTTAAFGIGGES